MAEEGAEAPEGVTSLQKENDELRQALKQREADLERLMTEMKKE